MKRPLAVSAVALIMGILTYEWIPSLLWGLIVVLLFCLVLFLIFRKLPGHSPFMLLALPFMLTGFFVHLFQSQFYQDQLLQWAGHSVLIDGFILDEPVFMEGKTTFTLNCDRIDDRGSVTQLKNTKIKVNVYCEDSIKELQYGSHVRLKTVIKIPPGKRNIGGFDYSRFLAARGISGTSNINPMQIYNLEGTSVFPLKETGYAIRRSILDSLYGSLPEKEASVVAGMLIGYTQDIPESMEESFRRAGLSHIMAVSGANIAFLLFPLMWLLKRLGFNRKWSSAISLPAMIFYVFATGMEASVIRAAIMAGITLIGMILWRQTDIYCSMAVSVILILLYNTFMLFDPGFMLSYLATLSLVVFHKPVFSRLPVKIPKFIRDTLAGTFSAQLGVVPVIAVTFNTFSVVSILSNLIIVPITGILTVAGALLAIFWVVIRPLCSLLGIIVSFMTDVILFVTQTISQFPWAELAIATPGVVLVAGYYVILLTIRYGLPRLKKEYTGKLLAAMLAVYGCFILISLIPSGTLEIYFTDVGQGDSCVIKTPSGKNILIDGGGSINDEEHSYTGERVVVPLLYDLGVTEIDVMIASHGHADHINGLKSVIDKMHVKRLIIADADDSEMNELTDYAINKGIRVERANESDILYSEKDLYMTVLYPLENRAVMPSTRTANANELSLVIRLDYGEFCALFTGDIGFETEARIMGQEALDCDLLKVPHHGSKYSSSLEFIKRVSPALAVISVGENTYGHPAPEVEQRLLDSGVRLYETILDGGVLVKINSNSSCSVSVRTVIQ